MIFRVFSVKDLKAVHFFEPFFCPTVPVAIRAFLSVAKPDSGTQIALYPNDYELWEIGQFDNLSGRFIQDNDPVCHGSAAEVLFAAE